MLEVSGASGGYKDIQVLWDISLSVDAGQALVVLGRNGAGKTSLLKAIGGLLPNLTRGRTRLGDLDITDLTPDARARAGLGFVQEGKQIFHRRTVQENLLLGGYSVKRPLHFARAELREALEFAYDRFPLLAERRRERAGRLSGGQQQMLAIAQALMASPRVLMLDEISAGLAPAIVESVFEIVSGLKDSGLTLLIAEQMVEHALEIADSVSVLESGRIVASGNASQFDDLEIIRDLYLGKV